MMSHILTLNEGILGRPAPIPSREPLLPPPPKILEPSNRELKDVSEGAGLESADVDGTEIDLSDSLLAASLDCESSDTLKLCNRKVKPDNYKREWELWCGSEV